ncbi:MAG: hypothetical protein GY797_32860 [Deltaproteobacteria bacterium]|nr:hypothetical protein [Deltaproteobacteria bacterium]
MLVKVTLSLYVDDETCLDIDVINQNVEKYKGGLVSAYHNGILSIIEFESAEPSLEIEDELQGQVPDICFQALPELFEKQSVIFGNWAYGGHIEIQLIDKYVHFSGTHIPKTRFSKVSLLPALYECGMKYLYLLHRLNEHNGNFTKRIEIIENKAQLAKKTLESQNLI